MSIKTIKTYREAISKICKNKNYGDANGYLSNPTPSNIRDACMHFFSIRNNKNDMDILNRFFQFPTEKDKLKHIKKFDIDKFRPVKNFLKGDTVKPKTEVLDLIAWLIDFKQRPYYEYSKSKVEIVDNVPSQSKNNDTLEDKKDKNTDSGGNNKWKEKIIIIIFSILSITLLYKNYNSNSTSVDNSNECMAWKKTRYVKISCDFEIHPKYGTTVIPMNKKRMETMKKIVLKRSDVIFSPDNEPLYWYCKIAPNEVEFFTTTGRHPISKKTLKAISRAIFNKYVPIHINDKDSFVNSLEE